MNASDLNKIQDDYNRITKAIEKAVKADRSLVTVENWFAHLCDDSSVIRFDVNVPTNVMHVEFEIYTSTTGGSYEFPEAEIPLDTLNRYL